MPKIQFFILIFNLWANRGGTDQWVGCVVSHFPSLCWRSDKIPLLLPVLLASADLPEELLLSPCACCSECLLSSPCPPTYHPPIHPPTVHQSSKGPVAGWTRGGEKWTRVCVCVWTVVWREWERKQERKGGGWVWKCSIVCYSSAQSPMEHWESGMPVPLADFSSGRGLIDHRWVNRTEKSKKNLFFMFPLMQRM